jgi:small-conductance mechanosensitive channel/CRP-like cAMP-binding protein
MPINERNKRVGYFLLLAAAVAILLLLFPIGDEWLRIYLLNSRNLIVDVETGAITNTSGEPANGMAASAAQIVFYLVTVLKIILWMAVIISVVRYSWLLITRTLYRNSAPGEISSIVKTILSVVIYIISFFIIFQSFFPKIQLAPLFTGSTIIGIVVGLALQDTLGNLFAGLALQADQPFQVGDVVTISTQGTGVVEAVSWRGVKIRTFNNRVLIISNSVLGKEIIEVAPKDNLNARTVFFNSLYSNSPARTIQTVRDAIRQVENVSSKIRPVVRIRNLGDNGIEWEVKYWLDDYTMQNDTDALIRQRIWYVFRRENIEFAFPTRTIHIEPKSEDIEEQEVLNLTVERLNQVSIFTPLSSEEIERLANASSNRVFAPGETIVQMGREGNSMFVIIRGLVRVQIPTGSWSNKVVNELRENDFFGEMSLLTGEPRSANVIAAEETEVLQIRKEALKPILEANPNLIESISRLVAQRRELLQSHVLQSAGTPEEDGDGILSSIRRFFGLN